jgi:hypothetical protein
LSEAHANHHKKKKRDLVCPLSTFVSFFDLTEFHKQNGEGSPRVRLFQRTNFVCVIFASRDAVFHAGPTAKQIMRRFGGPRQSPRKSGGEESSVAGAVVIDPEAYGGGGGAGAVAISVDPPLDGTVSDLPPNVSRISISPPKGQGRGDDATAQQQPVTAGEALKAAGTVLEDEQRALKRIERRIGEMEDIAQGAGQQLGRDREVMDQVDHDIDEIDLVLKRSRKELIAVMRNIARNKCFLALSFLVLLVVIFLVIAAARGTLFGRSTTASPMIVINNGTAATVV